MAPRAGPRSGRRRGAEDRGQDPQRLAGQSDSGEPALRETAPAKVNLHLHVTGRRADGYHLLDSLVVFAAAADEIEVAPSDGLTLAMEGPEAGALAAEPDNLVLRAARTLADAAGVPARAAITLRKHLPVASGIGGGSADAAAALRALDALWSLGWPEGRLGALAGSLGADVPACVASRPCRMGGVGEVLRPAPALPPCGIVLANPRVPLATPAVFRARSGAFTADAALPTGWPDAVAMARDLARLGNDLESGAISLCPAVAGVLAALWALPGCLLARMSGSGATCFALFAGPGEAAHAAGMLPGAWWRWGGGLHGTGG